MNIYKHMNNILVIAAGICYFLIMMIGGVMGVSDDLSIYMWTMLVFNSPNLLLYLYFVIRQKQNKSNLTTTENTKTFFYYVSVQCALPFCCWFFVVFIWF